MSDYHAHYNPISEQYQTNYAHSKETAELIRKKNPFSCLENVAYLTALFHDAGKYSDVWQSYFEKRIKSTDASSGGKIDHATAGGQLMDELLPLSSLSQMVQLAIYSHHGLQDCISPEDGRFIYEKRKKKAFSLPVDECRTRFYSEFNKNQLEELCRNAQYEIRNLNGNISKKMEEWNLPDLYGNRDFFLGLYERLLMSLLIDADRRNTEDFMSGGDICAFQAEKEGEILWLACAENIEKKIASFSDKRGINQYRSEISDVCRNVSTNSVRRYRLTVPTGAGKTLSSLRFAVNHAIHFHKKRIIYAAPFHSIVDQNADEIREALGMPDIVLEHHCNVVMENEGEQARYDRITEDWSSPVVVTTAVQFLNTLFSGKTASVRRMHSLCDSIIIMDEVQALPVRIIELFNMAMNFLSEFAGATVVLCTATQPLLEELPRNRLLPSQYMVPLSARYEEKFRRTQLVDDTALAAGGMRIETAAHYVMEKAQKYESVLFIANTKACARKLFEMVSELSGEEFAVQHLSTSMCPAHRKDVLNRVNQCLLSKKRQICISTQMVEAGVNLSFRCVIRSLAGLDSVIQAAGRCNRHREAAMGYVFLVKMHEEAENLSHLKDIRLAQQASLPVLTQFSRHPESLEGSLDSAKAVNMYFQYYYAGCQKEMCYPVTVKGVSTSLVNLLSANPDFCRYGKNGPILKQAFQTAGELFEMIDDGGKTPLVVPYRKNVQMQLDELENRYLPLEQKKQILRELQMDTVSVSETERRKIENGIREIWGGNVLVLDERFYNKNTGVVTEPAPLPDLFM
ncbi:MAG: CRISPR-associated helicase Cas3' [Lachnospiraceae bacterium]|nr:CRISPR-associated helicase Cas3' [Lachnospiraceae bacterium]